MPDDDEDHPAMTRCADVTATIQLRILADLSVMNCSFRYYATDPYAVHTVFSADDVTVCWVFARTLIIDGLNSRTPIGDGDVQVWTAGNQALISLTSTEGRAVLQGSVTDIRDFLDRTLALVPLGEETAHLDMDAVLARLLS